MMNEMHHSMDQFYGRVSANTTLLTTCFVHTGKKSSVIIIKSSSPQNNLLFIIFQNSIKDDLDDFLKHNLRRLGLFTLMVIFNSPCLDDD